MTPFARGAPRPPARRTNPNDGANMTITHLFATLACRLERRIERGQQQHDDVYLAQATDHADLELRQRRLAQPQATIPNFG